MWNDPIVEEVREARQAYARKFNFDLQAIVADLRRQQADSNRTFLTLAPRKPILLPKVSTKHNR